MSRADVFCMRRPVSKENGRICFRYSRGVGQDTVGVAHNPTRRP